MALVSGTKLGSYQITSLLGSGGMGDVYLAKDVKLGRKVALKVLPEALSKDEDRLRRFKREARAASALDHPNIVTIHDISEAEGHHFIVMQYVPGKTLGELLLRGAYRAQANTRLRIAGYGRTLSGSQPGCCSPRPQARQPHGDGRRIRQDPGFRPRKTNGIFELF